MKILHISTFSGGGAGIAARRLHQGLLAAGVDSSFLSFDDPNLYLAKRPSPKPSFLRRSLNRIKRELIRISLHNPNGGKEALDIKGDFEIFTSPITNFDLTLHPAYKGADIINLHWVANFLDYSSFFEKNKKPIVWTLHDMNPFQGGFHYHDDVVRNASTLGEIEEQYKRLKHKALFACNNIHVVGLSNWIMSESKRSETFSRFPHYLIPNGININLFKPYNQSLTRDLFGLPSDKIIILFVSENLSNKRKGFDLMLKCIKFYEEKDDIIFCAVGSVKGGYRSKNLIYVDAIKDERLMALLYSAADVFVLPSREDNLPNVMLEALACGVPVISTPVGGSLDIINNDINGFITKDISAEHLQRAINSFISRKESFNACDIRNSIASEYTSEIQVKKYIELYKKISN